MRMSAPARRAMTVLCLSSILSLVAGEPSGLPASPELLGILNEALVYEYDELKSTALRAYESLGPRALQGLPVLAGKIRNAATSTEAAPFAQAFLMLGDGVLPEVKKMIEAKETQALIALAEAADKVRAPKEVVELLADHSDPKVSLVVRQRLSANSFKAPTYIKAGSGQDSRTRLTTMQGLHGRVTEEYRDYMVAALGDPYPEVRMLALRLLGDLKPATQATADAVGRVLLEDEEDQVKFSAAHGLGSMGAPALPWLIKGLQSPREQIRHASLNVMNRFGKEAAEALPVLRELAEKETANDKIYAIRAIACITGDQEPAIAKYLEALTQEDRIQLLREKALAMQRDGNRVRSPEEEQASQLSRERDEAMRELGKIGPPVADRVLPVLRKYIFEAKTTNGLFDPFAEFCLGALPNFGVKGRSLLLEAVGHPQQALAQAALLKARQAMDKNSILLLSMARQADPKIQMFAAQQMFLQPLEQVTATATAVLRSTDRGVRLQGLQTAAHVVRRGAPGFRRVLAGLPKDPDAEIQKLAADLLAQLPPRPDEDPEEEIDPDELATRIDAPIALARKGQCPPENVPLLHGALRTGLIPEQDLSAVLAALKSVEKPPPALRATVLACAQCPRHDLNVRQAALGVVLAWEPAANRENLLVEWLTAREGETFYETVARELAKCSPNVFTRLVQLARNPGSRDGILHSVGAVLRAAGPQGLPALMELLADPKTREEAVYPLGMLGAAAEEKVRPLLSSTDASCVSTVLRVLSIARPSDPATAAALREVCAQGPVQARGPALRVLAERFPRDPGIQKAVVEGLLSNDSNWKAEAARLAAEGTVDVTQAVTELSGRLSAARTPQEQQAVLTLLRSMGAQALPCLQTVVTAQNAELREQVWSWPVWASIEALPVLAALLRSPDGETRAQAALMLRLHMPLSVIPLRAALKGADPELQKLAREELALYGSLGKAVLEGKL